MRPIPDEFQWKTNDGRVLDIRWMDTQHLTNCVNLVMRNSSISRARVEQGWPRPHNQATAVFMNMVKELQARSPLEWTTKDDGRVVLDQIVPTTLMREDLKTMCLMRAMLDTNIHWPQVVSRHDAMRTLRMAPESVFLSIEQHRASNPHPDLFKLLAKFTEYRLERT